MLAQTIVETSTIRLPHRPVTADPLAQRLETGAVRTIEAKDHLYQDGDAASHVYLVEAGHICIYRTTPDGRRQVIDFGYPGDVIGLGAIGEHASSAQATTRTRVRCLPTGVLQQAVREDGRVGLKLYEAMSRELNASRDLLFTVSQRTACERVASFLLTLSRRNTRNGESPRELVLPMTRSDIADFLGLTIETVSRTFTKLRADGVIDLAQCILVTIRDDRALERLAEGRAD
jgi:CRP/FNR family transcriptional regulator